MLLEPPTTDERGPTTCLDENDTGFDEPLGFAGPEPLKKTSS